MEIEVRDNNEIVFTGYAEDFLFMKENDIELEILLDKLERKPYNSIIRYENMEIEKIKSLMWDWMKILYGKRGKSYGYYFNSGKWKQ